MNGKLLNLVSKAQEGLSDSDLLKFAELMIDQGKNLKERVEQRTLISSLKAIIKTRDFNYDIVFDGKKMTFKGNTPDPENEYIFDREINLNNLKALHLEPDKIILSIKYEDGPLILGNKEPYFTL